MRLAPRSTRIEAEKISWKEDNNFMQKYIREIGEENFTRLPKGLDIKPYHDGLEKA